MTDQKLTDYASDFRRAIIGTAPSAWWCAGISAPLHAALCVLGVVAQIVESDLGDCNHVFLMLQDGRVLDPTADQFNWCNGPQLPSIYLGAPSVIHQNADPYGGQCWDALVREFRRLCPRFGAREVGGMVRMTLDTLPAGTVKLPELMYG